MTENASPATDSQQLGLSSGPLSEKLIAVPETRQLNVFAELLERRGATVRRCPLVGIHDAPDPAPVLAWLNDFIAGSCDDLVLLTGEGLRRLYSLAERQSPALDEDLTSALANVRTICRGPKPNKALREHGLHADISAEAPTTDGVIATLSKLDLQGRRIGVQLYGTEPNTKLIEAITNAGATALPVAPYVYADEAERQQVSDLIVAIIAGELDAIAFTSTPQVRRLLTVAKKDGREAELLGAMNKMCVASVGPVVTELLEARGITVTVAPESSFFMKPLATAIGNYFAVE